MEIENLTSIINGEIVTANFNSGNCKVKVQFNVASLPDFKIENLSETVSSYLFEHLN